MSSKDVTKTEAAFTDGYSRLLTMTDLDYRRTSAMQIRTLTRALAKDLNLHDNPSVPQRMMLARCAMLDALCTHHEVALLLGRAIPLADYVQMAGTLRRLLLTLKAPGLRRVAKNINTGMSGLWRDELQQEQGEQEVLDPEDDDDAD
jgi:hypothetical protein